MTANTGRSTKAGPRYPPSKPPTCSAAWCSSTGRSTWEKEAGKRKLLNLKNTVDALAELISKEAVKLLGKYTKLVDQFKAQTDALSALLDHNGGSAEKHAKYMRDKIVPAMATLRDIGDQIEVLTPHEIRPLPIYREMLFVK